MWSLWGDRYSGFVRGFVVGVEWCAAECVGLVWVGVEGFRCERCVFVRLQVYVFGGTLADISGCWFTRGVRFKRFGG